MMLMTNRAGTPARSDPCATPPARVHQREWARRLDPAQPTAGDPR